MTFRGRPRDGLVGATTGFFFGFAAVSLFGPTAARFKEIMHLTAEQVGWLVAIPALSGSLLRIPFAAWVDSIGGRKPFLVLMALALAGMAGLTTLVAVSYPDHMMSELYGLLLILGVFCGCGIATFSVGISQVSYWYPQKEQGSALGIYAGVGNLAPGLFSLILPFVLEHWGLSITYALWLALLGIGTFLYWRLGMNSWYFQARSQGYPPEDSKRLAQQAGQEFFPARTLVESLGRSARNWRTWALVGLYFTSFGGYIALTAWFPIFWKEAYGQSIVQAGLLAGCYSILTSAVRVVGGRLADRCGGERVIELSLLILAAGAFVMTRSLPLGGSLGGGALIAIGMGLCNGAVFKLLPAKVPESVGGASGWVGGLGALGGFVIPPVLAVQVNQQGNAGYAFGFWIFVGLAMGSLGLAALLKGGRSISPSSPT